MSDLRGIIVTARTIHLYAPGRGLDPACGNEQVITLMEGLRRRYRTGDRTGPPIFGPAGRRKACGHCIRALDRIAVNAAERAAEARAHNEEVPGG